MVRGLSDNDEGADDDPVPHLNRDRSTPNGHLIGRERLVAGDRLIWLSDHARVVFEIHGFGQVLCRTWDLRFDPETDFPLLLNHPVRPMGRDAADGIRDILALAIPRTWAPRNPDPEDGWLQAGTQKSKPEDWRRQLPQLRLKE
jgi:hypothetical protein